MDEEQMEYSILFRIPYPYSTKIRRLMAKIATVTGIPPPHRLPPHITFHKPITRINESVLKNLVKSVVLRTNQTRVVIHGLSTFGTQYIVLPVFATRSAVALWVGIDAILSRLPEYEHGKFDHDNTLHITVAERTSHVFNRAWPEIKKIECETMTIPLQHICLYRKPLAGGSWDHVASYHLPE